MGLPTGVALLVYLVAAVALPVGLLVCVAIAAGAVIVAWRRMGPDDRLVWSRRVKAGLVAGVGATAAYDVSRFALAALPGVEIRPWEALPLFGELLTGAAASSRLAAVAGFLYHVANGVGFGVTYAILFGRRGVLAGIGFALVLEAVMLAVYPGWLDIRARAEFTSVSMMGHVAYGAALGSLVPWLLTRAGRIPS